MPQVSTCRYGPKEALPRLVQSNCSMCRVWFGGEALSCNICGTHEHFGSCLSPAILLLHFSHQSINQSISQAMALLTWSVRLVAS